MANQKISAKHIQINKTNTTTTIIITVAAFITVFSLFASKSMLDQRAYNSRVIKEKETAVKTLRSNIEAVDKLVISYKEFIGRPTNIIGGNTLGTGDQDGDNAKLVLDALPSKYDFPAVISSLEKIVTRKQFADAQFQGTDDELAHVGKAGDVPQVVEIPFIVSVSGSYDSMNDLIETLEKSIRPVHLTSLKIGAGTQGQMSLAIEAKTFYQSEKSFNVTTKVVQ